MLVALAALAGFYLWLGWYDDLGSLYGDGLNYFLAARHFSPFGPPDPTADAYAAIANSPPLYSLLLALTGGAQHFVIAHAVTVLSTIAAFAAIYAWFLSLDLRRGLPVAGMLLFGMMPGTLEQALRLQTESLYMACAFAGLALLRRAERDSSTRGWWLAASAFALAMLTRAAGLLLLPALAVVFLRRRPKSWPLVLLVSFAPLLLWSATHSSASSYGGVLGMVAGWTPDALVRLVAAASSLALDGAASNVFYGDRGTWLPLVLALAAALVAIVRFAKGESDAWYLAAYGAVLAIWPFPREMPRLTWVVLPVVLGHLLWASTALAARVPAAQKRAGAVVAWLPAAIVALIVVPTFALLVQRAFHPLVAQEPALRHIPEFYETPFEGAIVAASAEVLTPRAMKGLTAAYVPPKDCVLTMHPVSMQYYTNREIRIVPNERTDDATFDKVVHEYGCHYVMFTLLPGHTFDTPFYPLERLKGRIEILGQQKFVAPGGREYTIAALGRLQDGAAP